MRQIYCCHHAIGPLSRAGFEPTPEQDSGSRHTLTTIEDLSPNQDIGIYQFSPEYNKQTLKIYNTSGNICDYNASQI